jgi:hypothetical protein
MCVDCVIASPRIAQVDPRDEPLFEVILSQLVYDLMGLSGVTIVRPGVAGVLQMVLEPTLMVSRARTGQGRGSSGRDTV